MFEQGKDACGHLEMVPTGNTPPSPIQHASMSSPHSPQTTGRLASPTSTGDKRVEAVVRSLEVTRKLNNVLIDLVEDLTILTLNDGESSSASSSSTVGTSVEHFFS
ncbi:hypothetical protein RND81_14G178600 [Saponaria officinalis]|uniref:Uncharacterized protein n=1 Tax=Saponaria officinalis TaxID=3572 RepID=A0AAW1GNM9_SAPOF